MGKILSLVVFLFSSNMIYGAFGYLVTSEEEALYSIKKESSTFSKDQNTHSLFLWNVFKEGKRHFSAEFEKFQNKYHPSIALFQEATIDEEWKSSSCLKDSDCYFSEAFKFKDKGFGVLTSSQYPITYAEAIHSDLTEPILNTPKTSLLTVISIKGIEVLIVNTHGINFVTLTAYEEQLKEIVKKAKDFRGPMIWAGDFNSWNPGRYNLLETATKALELEELKINHLNLVKSFLGFKLDRVFTRGLSSLKAQAIECESSDHNPILIEFSLY